LGGVGVGYLQANSHKIKTPNLASMPAIPFWKNPQCVSANINELEYFEIAASTLEHIAPHSADWLAIGAVRALSDDLYRSIPGQLTGPRVCAPPEIYARVAVAFVGKPMKGRFDLYDLKLAAHMQSPPTEVVDAVAEVAFSRWPVTDDGLEGHIQGDIRPFARTVLAGFGRQASKYAREAFEQISDKNSLGIGAAQVATAAGYPEALSQIDSMMNQLLASVPNERPIPIATRDRLYELAWAIYFSGDSAKDHAAPLIKLMERRVQSGAPPFGGVDLPPKRMCEVLSKIYGDDKSVTNKFTYCTDDSPLESYPRGAFAVASTETPHD